MLQRFKPYLFNALVTSIIALSLAIFLGVTPFGHSSMLTIDLSQQYVDFFSLFKDTLLHHPEKFLYSFEKGFGGEMIGLWAYYLMSPFNFMLLLFKDVNLVHAVTIMTYLKIVAASSTMFYFIRHKYPMSVLNTTLFANCYAFMNYIMIYMLNIMWLDGMILLPLIALGLDRIITHRSGKLYVLSLSLLFIANYYIGYMVALFLAMYAFYVISEYSSFKQWKAVATQYATFVGYSLVSALLSGIMLIPTFTSLLDNKASHMKTGSLSWETVYNLKDVLSKIFIASYTSDEISKGSPNFYAGIIIFALLGFYYANRKINWQEKMVTGFMAVMFYLPFHFEFFDKLWHGGQFPIWYPFRFSFTLSFMLIILAIKGYRSLPKIIPLPWIFASIAVFASICFYYVWDVEFEYVTFMNISLTLAFFLGYIILVQIDTSKPMIQQSILLLLVCVELFTNAAFILQEMNYLPTHKFQDYVTILNQAVEPYAPTSDEFYRVHTTFQRTKNEAMFVHVPGLDHFGSTIEAVSPKLYGYLGFPDTNGSINYTNGTFFTDDFFDVRYFVAPSSDTIANTKDEEYLLFPTSEKMDLYHYSVVENQPRYTVRENKQRLGFASEVSKEILTAEFQNHQPIQNQELLLSLIFPNNSTEFFKEVPMGEMELTNAEIINNGDGDFYTYQKIDAKKPAFVDVPFSTTTGNTYYFTLPSQWNSKNIAAKLNGHKYRITMPYRTRQVANASYRRIMADQKLTIELLKEEMKANKVYLYEFDQDRYDQLIAQKQPTRFNVTHWNHRSIEGKGIMEGDDHYLLLTVPNDPSWHFKVNDQPVQAESVLNDTLMAVPVPKGEYTLKMTYFPYSLVYGAISTLIGAIAFAIILYYERKNGIINH